MTAKLLIVEDECIVALDLRQELEEFGCEITGLAESAEAAMRSVEECRPDLVLMDIKIDGAMDGIETARHLRRAYKVPVVFLTSHSDKQTLDRAAKELPYGYLTKPFKSRELQATLRVALHKAAVDADLRQSSQLMSMTIEGVPEAVVLLSADGIVQYMNRAAEEMAGLKLLRARGLLLTEVFQLREISERPVPLPVDHGRAVAIEEFGWSLFVPGRDRMIVDFSVRSVVSSEGSPGGYVIALRNATERMHQAKIEPSRAETQTLANRPGPMLQVG